MCIFVLQILSLHKSLNTPKHKFMLKILINYSRVYTKKNQDTNSKVKNSQDVFEYYKNNNILNYLMSTQKTVQQ